MSKDKRIRRTEPAPAAAIDIPPDGGAGCGAEQISIGSVSTPLPRPERRPRRAKADRGLPADVELEKLASAYLARQRMRWPALVEAGLLPEATDEVIHAMVDDFKTRHRTGKIDSEAARAFPAVCKRLGGNYNRFSCDNSSPNSALDQMVNALDRAAADERFIPWLYVFADYSVTGLDASRQGYSSYKKVVADKDQLIETTYIDDFTRASRDEIEWWKLAALSKRLNKRMIGASDGFDLNSASWEVQIALYGLLSRLFIKSLREKVKRGMSGAARRGTCLGKLSLGFSRRARLDENGKPVLGPDSLPIYEPCIDPATRDARLLAFQLYAEQKWSAARIARRFSELKIDGWGGWTGSAIKKLLWSPTAIGIFVWNQFRQEYDWDAEKVVKVKNPRSQWQIYFNRELAIVPLELWRAARRRLAETRRNSPMTGRKYSRNQISSTTLFSGTLICGYCGQELKLIRSTSKYKQFGCLNGAIGAHDCQLRTSKSVRIVEECLLGFLRDPLLMEARYESFVERANYHLVREAERPQVDVRPLKAKRRKADESMRKLVRMVERTDDAKQCNAYHQRIVELQKESNRLGKEIRDAEVANRKEVKQLELATIKKYLDEFHATLNESIPQAADALRSLTGPITIRAEAIEGRKNGARWIATFSPDLLAVLRHSAPDEMRAAYLDLAGSLEAQSVEVAIEKVPRYELLAEKFLEMEANGASIATIASAHKVSWAYAQEILHFAKTGERPQWKAGNRTGKGGTPCKYKEIAKTVVRLRDREKMPFEQIAAKLGVSHGTVMRAYDHLKPDAVMTAAESGKRPQRGGYSKLGELKYRKMRKMLAEGAGLKEVAAEVGCSEGTVRRVRKELEAEHGDGRAA